MSNPLGKNVPYPTEFDESVLFPIERGISRTRLSIKEPLPFEGSDRWTAYEISWLNSLGTPQVAIARISYPAGSPFLVESKSLKLFLGGLNFKRFDSPAEVSSTIQSAIVRRLQCEDVCVSLALPEEWGDERIVSPPGECVDRLPIESEQHFKLRAGEVEVEETIYSNLLRSLCPVTAQPDWGTVCIYYKGRQLERSSLVGYLLAHRSQQGYHEECCEVLFTDILATCTPTKLWVGCFYTRRGGLDINPERWLPGTERPRVEGRLARQ